jgi:hypothetical protein
LPIFGGKKIAFFFKNNVAIRVLHTLPSSVFSICLAKYFKIITSVPDAELVLKTHDKLITLIYEGNSLFKMCEGLKAQSM